MRYAPAVTAVLAFIISMSAACIDGKPGYNDFWVWSDGGGSLKTLTSNARFQAMDDGRIMWDIINASATPVTASVRVTHCNGSPDITPEQCPFTVTGSTCELTVVAPAYGEAVAKTLDTTLRDKAKCPVSVWEGPLEWLIGRQRWHVSLDATAEGSTASYDPELQIDRGKGPGLALNALLIAAGAAALHVAARQLRRLLGL